MKRLLLILFSVLMWSGLAQAQGPAGVAQHGAITPNNCVSWTANGLIQDAGAGCGNVGGIVSPAHGGTGINNGTNTLTFQSGANTAAITNAGQTFTGSPQIFPYGANATGGGFNANASVVGAYWPNASTDCAPGIQFGVSTTKAGFVSNNGGLVNVCVNGVQTAWLNRAWTFMDGRAGTGALGNVANTYPGSIQASNSWRYQNYDTNGDFRTDGTMAQTVYSGAAYTFESNITNGSATITNLIYNPVPDGLLTPALAQGPVNIYEHSGDTGQTGDGPDITVGETMASFTSTTITMNHNAINTVSGQDFSWTVIAPAGNSSFGTYYSNVHMPFQGDLTAGDPVIRNLVFNPQRLGFPAYATLTETSNSGADITANVRIIEYTNTTLRMGDPTTGVPVNALHTNTGQTFVLDFKDGPTVTFTGDVSSSSPLVKNLSFNPISGTTTLVGGAWDKPQWQNTSKVFPTSTTVSSVTASTIVLSTTATTPGGSPLTAFDSKIELAKTKLVFQALAPYLDSYLQIGWDDASSSTRIRLAPNGLYPVYWKTTQLLNTTPQVVMDVNNTNVTTTNLSATNYLNFHTPTGGDGSTLAYPPLEYSAANLLLHANDLTNGGWTQTSITSVVGSTRPAPLSTQTEYTVTGSGAGGALSQSVTIAADTTSYTGSAYFDSTSTGTLYAVGINIVGSVSASASYNTATGVVSCSGAGATCGSYILSTLADGSTRRRVWVTAANAGASTQITYRLYADGLSGTGATISSMPQLEAVGANTLPGPTSWISTTTASVTRATGQLNPLLLPTFTSALVGAVPASGGGTTNFLRADGTFASPTASSVPSGTWGSIPAAGTAGNLYYCTNCGTTGTLMLDTGTRWKPNTGCTTLATKDTAQAGIANSETITFQYLIPTGLINFAGDRLRLWWTGTKSGTTDTGEVGIRMGTAGTTGDTSLYAATNILVAANKSYGAVIDFRVASATTIQQQGANQGSGITIGYSNVSSSAQAAAKTITTMASNALWFSLTMQSSSTNDTVGNSDAHLQWCASGN